MEKPDVVYHGSCSGIKDGYLIPRLQHGDINGLFPDGSREVIFATHDKELATLYTLKNQYMLGAGVTDGHNFAVFRDYDAWKADIDKQACKLYALPAKSFTQSINSRTGKPTIEWQSNTPVQATDAIEQTSDTVMQTGAQLFFLDKSISKELWNFDEAYPEHDSFMNRIERKVRSGHLPKDISPLQIYQALIDQGLMTHLNKDRDINPLHIEQCPYKATIQEDIDWLKEQMLDKPKRTDGKEWTEALGSRTGISNARI